MQEKGSIVNVATRLGAGRSGVRIPVGTSKFSPKCPYLIWGLFSWYRRSFLGVVRPGREVNHSPPHSTEVKNEWRYNSGAWGGIVVKTIRYYSDDPGIDSRWFHLIFQ
jgi:hypothetical protein